MEEIYPAFAEEIYKIEKEIFKSDSTYEKNEALRNAVHSAVVLVSKTAIEEYGEKCVNLNGFEAIKKIADLYQINLFHGFPILFNMDDDKERNFSIMLSKAVDEAYRDPYNVEEELGRQIEVLQSNYTQSWYYVIDFKSATGFCFYTISRVTGASDKKATQPAQPVHRQNVEKVVSQETRQNYKAERTTKKQTFEQSKRTTEHTEKNRNLVTKKGQKKK